MTIAFRSLSKTTSSGFRNRDTTQWIDTSRQTLEIRIIITISTVPWTRRSTSGCLITVSRSQAKSFFFECEGLTGLLCPLTKIGIDDALAKHIAHLFIRDPLVVFSERVDQDDETSMDHFENIQSTNWQTMRFKPPPVDSPIGWRVEFRSMEVQLTDFENAAYSVFIVLLTRAILSFNLNFYMPISEVGEHDLLR